MCNEQRVCEPKEYNSRNLIKYGNHKTSNNCSTFNWNAWTPTHGKLRYQRSLCRLPSRETVRVKADCHTRILPRTSWTRYRINVFTKFWLTEALCVTHTPLLRIASYPGCSQDYPQNGPRRRQTDRQTETGCHLDSGSRWKNFIRQQP